MKQQTDFAFKLTPRELIALKTIWEDKTIWQGMGGRGIHQSRAKEVINAAIDTTAEDPDQVMDAPADQILIDLHEMDVLAECVDDDAARTPMYYLPTAFYLYAETLMNKSAIAENGDKDADQQNLTSSN